MTPATLKRHYVALDKARTIARQAEAAIGVRTVGEGIIRLRAALKGESA